MTRKLKQQCKKIVIKTITVTLSLATMGAIGTKLLVMSKDTENIKKTIAYSTTNAIETAIVDTNAEVETNSEPESLNNVVLDTVAEENSQTKSKEPIYAEDGAIICESIVQATKEYNIPNGNHIFRVEGKNGQETETKDYAVEFINYGLNEDGSIKDITYTTNTLLGDTSTDKKMLIVKYHGNLTINAGVTVTATNVSNYTYKKGMYICVLRRHNQ